MKKFVYWQPGVGADQQRVAESQPIFTEKTISSRPVGHHQPMFTPALVVDGQVKIAGKVPSLEDTKKLLV